MSDRLAYRPAELARLVGVTRRTVWDWIRRGKLRCPNGLIPAEDVNRLIGVGMTPEVVRESDELDRRADAILAELEK